MTKKIILKPFVALSLLLSLMVSCESNNSLKTITLTDSEKNSLLFMLEEEKLARDTYTFLDEKWSNTPFSNILGSEQAHMDAVKSLLDASNTAYYIWFKII